MHWKNVPNKPSKNARAFTNYLRKYYGDDMIEVEVNSDATWNIKVKQTGIEHFYEPD